MKTILLIVCITMVCVVGFGVVTRITDGGTGTSQNINGSTIHSITVTVSGQIQKPGTYTVEVGQTIIDLITKAGGITSDADTLAFVPTHVCEAKQNYYIAPLRDNSSACAVEDIRKCNLNKASAEELRSVAGFSKTAAAAVVSYRASTVFETLEQITEVPSCGKATYITVRDKLRLRDAE